MDEKPAPRKQCAKCPWKVSTDPFQIPDGYCPVKHAGLKGTIAAPGQIVLGNLRVMACHESPVGKEVPCVGWLHNQMGVGNNIALRLAAASKLIDANVEIVGEQHACFEDTLPKLKRIVRDRPLTPQEAAKYRKIRAQIAQELPELRAKARRSRK